MAKRVHTPTLLTELEAIDLREDRILDTLLRRGERLERLAEEAEKERRVVRAEELRALKEGLAGLQVVAGEVQQRIAYAETEAVPPGNGTPPAGFDELAAQIRQQAAESDRLRALLRDRLGELKAEDNGHNGHNATTATTTTTRVVADEPRTFRLTTPPMTGRDVKAFQRLLNQRFATWKIDKRVREDGRYDPKTKHAAHQVAYGLGIAAKDDVGPLTPGLRALIRNPSRRTAQQLDRAQRRRPWLRKLREQHAGATPVVAAGSPAHGLAAAIHAHGGRYGRDHRQRSPAVGRARGAGLRRDRDGDALHQRVRARRGRQPGQEPTPAGARPRGHGGALPEVPRAPQARRGQPGRRADAAHGPRAAGSCRQAGRLLAARPEHPGRRRVPRDNIERFGRKAGIQAYNGASGDAYATSVLALEERWRTRLRERPAQGGGPAQARTFRLTNPPLHGRDVKAFQRVLNERFAAWKIDKRLVVDGRYGTETKRAARQAAYGLGITDANELGPVTPALRALIRTPSRRTARQVERARRRRPWLLGSASRSKGAGGNGRITTAGGARGIVEQAAVLAAEVGGKGVYVGSSHRPGDVLASGQPSDHSQNNDRLAARDIGVRGRNLLTGPPSRRLDKAVVAIGHAFGRPGYGNGRSGPYQDADTFVWKGYRIQIIWRTPKWGGHMGHIHIGARKL